jgi:hypothetical protein
MFFKGSRYALVGEALIDDGKGHVVRYKKTRFIPETAGPMLHMVRQGDRLDLIANLYFRDPERFWRICDANAVLWPDELTAEPGDKILIPGAEV